MTDQRFQFDEIPHGSGGFAQIIRGRDTFLERDIAVKILNPLVTEFSAEDRERFRREARILAKLSHPNIPAIYDVEFTDEQFLIIFEFVEGINLAQFIDERGPCSLTQARSWFSQLASALHHAHENGIVHRDIKPENIVLKPDLETAYLVDFGIALSAEDGRKITESGFVVGTPGYMSPEQQRGEDLDHLTDIYSLGVTLYEALAGQPIAVGAYTPLSATNEAIPAEIDSLVQDCILPRESRVPSARDFTLRLIGALRLQRPLSVVLAHGRLHEFALALEDLAAESLAALPEGQKALILAKVRSVVDSDDESLVFPGAELLQLMLTRGLFLDPDSYRVIANRAISWAFEKVYPNARQGRRTLQDSLTDACLLARGEAHRVLREEMEAFLQQIDLENKEDWYLHSLRNVLTSLMANPSFTSDARQMASFLQRINEVQRFRE